MQDYIYDLSEFVDVMNSELSSSSIYSVLIDHGNTVSHSNRMTTDRPYEGIT